MFFDNILSYWVVNEPKENRHFMFHMLHNAFLFPVRNFYKFLNIFKKFNVGLIELNEEFEICIFEIERLNDKRKLTKHKW